MKPKITRKLNNSMYNIFYPQVNILPVTNQTARTKKVNVLILILV